jgi:hypothetical protein
LTAQVSSNSAAVMSISGVLCERLTIPAASTAPCSAPKCWVAASKAPAMLSSDLGSTPGCCAAKYEHGSRRSEVLHCRMLFTEHASWRCGANLTSQCTKCALPAPTSATKSAPAPASRSTTATLPPSDVMRRVTAAPILRWGGSKAVGAGGLAVFRWHRICGSCSHHQCTPVWGTRSYVGCSLSAATSHKNDASLVGIQWSTVRGSCAGHAHSEDALSLDWWPCAFVTDQWTTCYSHQSIA